MPRGRPKTKPESEELVRYAGETSINHVAGDNYCIIYAGERKWYNWVLKMLKEHPDEIEVIKHYDTGFRSIEVKMPYRVMDYIKWPIKTERTEEFKQQSRENLAKVREARKFKKLEEQESEEYTDSEKDLEQEE